MTKRSSALAVSEDVFGDDGSSNEALWNTIREYVFQVVQRKKGQPPKTRLMVYFECLRARAQSGDAAAAREQMRLARYFEYDSKSDAVPVGHNRIRELIEAQTTKANFASDVLTVTYVFMIDEIRCAFEAVYGDLGPAADQLLPFPWNVERHNRLKAKILRSRRRKVMKGQPFEVGKGKPPAGSRFKPGESGNPTGLSKLATVAEDYRSVLLEIIPVVKGDGTRAKVPSIAIVVVQAFKQIISGDARDYASVRQYLRGLHERGLLSPPPPKSPESKIPKAELQMGTQVILTYSVRWLKRELVKVFTKKYGPVPDFTIALERACTPLDQIEGWSAYQKERGIKPPSSERKVERPDILVLNERAFDPSEDDDVPPSAIGAEPQEKTIVQHVKPRRARKPSSLKKESKE